MRAGFPLLASLILLASCACAEAATTAVPPLSGTKQTIETAGTAVAVALPLVAAGITYEKHDWKGMAQLATETLLTVGTAYALKNLVRERRPDGSDWQSFPSDTTALAGSGSSYLWGRYGWQYGLPAFLATQFVSYSRVQAKKHHWYDTLASSAIAASYGYVLTTPYKKKNVSTSLSVTPDGGYFSLSYRW